MEVSFVTRPLRVAGTSTATCSYPESELSYFKGVLNRCRRLPYYDDRLVTELLRVTHDGKKKQLRRMLKDLDSGMVCLSDRNIRSAGRGVLIPSQIVDNLDDFLKPSCRSFRWNKHYQWALKQVRAELGKAHLQALSIQESAEARSIQKNLDKNAGYIGYLLGKRSKGEVLDEAVNMAEMNEEEDLKRMNFMRPFVVAVRPQGGISKYVPESDNPEDKAWKVKDRVIQMTSLDHLIQENRIGDPVSMWFMAHVKWAEGGMSNDDLCREMTRLGSKYKKWLSLDYHHYDSSESDWLIEDAFMCIRVMFDESEYLDKLIRTICNSFINRRVDWNGKSWFLRKGVPSGSRFTYLINTIVNRIMTLTTLHALGVKEYDMMFCGDDAIIFYNDVLNINSYTKYITLNFGILLSKEKCTSGIRGEAPKFLSRYWYFDGAERNFVEVLFNLRSPERFRNYVKISRETGIKIKTLVQLIILAAYYDQKRTLLQWVDVDLLKQELGVNSEMKVHEVMARAKFENAEYWLEQARMKREYG